MINTNIAGTKSEKKDCTTYELITTVQQKIIVHLSGSPTSLCVEEYSRFMKRIGVTDVFCFCNPSYDPNKIEANGIRFHNLSYPDGSFPPSYIIDLFNQKITYAIAQNIQKNPKENIPLIINMHCESGLGRSPTIIAYLMISRCDIARLTAIEQIRKLRKNSFNRNQLKWILHANIKKIKSKSNSFSISKCVIM